MSLCRWSSDNFRCDLYVYEGHDGNYYVHVAGSRYEGDIPPIDTSSPERWIETHEEQKFALTRLPLVPIGGPFDGDTYVLGDAESLRDKLLVLRESGYRFPDYVLDSLNEEGEGTEDGDVEAR